MCLGCCLECETQRSPLRRRKRFEQYPVDMQPVAGMHDHGLGEIELGDELTEGDETVLPCGVRLVRATVYVDEEGLGKVGIALAAL